MADDRLDEILRRLDGIETRMTELSDRLGRQVAVTEALRSDMRLLTGLTRSILAALQALVDGYADLITNLENPASET